MFRLCKSSLGGIGPPPPIQFVKINSFECDEEFRFRSIIECTERSIKDLSHFAT